ncbi:MAG: transporter [Rikenellaceae bacterium]
MSVVAKIKQNRRPLLMLLCMTLGVALFRPLSVVDSLTHHTITPVLIFSMLFVTFCRVKIHELKFTWLHLSMILFQVVASPIIYVALLPFGELVAQGGMICLLTPVAMGAVAIVALLGGNVSVIAGYTLVCNLVIAFVAPYYLDIFGNGECTLLQILSRVAPLLLMPLVAAQSLKKIWLPAAEWIAARSQMSFYMWLLTMLITLARTTNYIVEVHETISLSVGLSLALVALVACVVQYLIGHIIGVRHGEAVAGTQSLGQKNTMLAVWLAQSFLSPVSSIAPTAYIIWQNLANSYQIYRYENRQR